MGRIRDKAKYADKLAKDVAYLSNKLVKLSYLLDNEARSELIESLTSISNIALDICDRLVSESK